MGTDKDREIFLWRSTFLFVLMAVYHPGICLCKFLVSNYPFVRIPDNNPLIPWNTYLMSWLKIITLFFMRHHMACITFFTDDFCNHGGVPSPLFSWWIPVPAAPFPLFINSRCRDTLTVQPVCYCLPLYSVNYHKENSSDNLRSLRINL